MGKNVKKSNGIVFKVTAFVVLERMTVCLEWQCLERIFTNNFKGKFCGWRTVLCLKWCCRRFMK